MPLDALSTIPSWFLFGVLGGVGASIAVGSAFYFGERFFPAPERTSQRHNPGASRRRSEIRAYLRAIEEPFTEGAEVAGEVVDFYLPDRDVVVTFDARIYFALQSHTAYVILCEHEMPGAQLGRRLPFEVPRLGPSLDSTPDPVVAAFDRLDITPGADESEIKRAYRDRVKEVHPDQGGTSAEFTQVREAYSTALNHAGRQS
ncbi:J domain-containing protein [Halalkalirubrum salinum]|uniref:J domain-containing protein n=1 Tax=Halalkalirubrum salinum TaxID=2563889 RepID=UPI0010FB255F|nr:J domain-containing protein [Halalkalirubrum salinum]